MKWILWTLAVLAGITVIVTVIGWLLPREHVATLAARYHQTPQEIWKVITDVDDMPSWREGLKSVKRLPDRNGLPAHLVCGNVDSNPRPPRDRRKWVINA